MRSVALTWCLLAHAAAAGEPQLESGDVVFQTSRSAQSLAIQHITQSPYSHVGLVEVSSDGAFVLEAIGTVSRTPWRRFRARGAGGKVLVLRLGGLSPAQRGEVLAAARRFLGRPYDAQFGWGDERLYCSELVHKAYLAAGVELGALERLGQLHVAGMEAALRARYGRVPLGLELVTPASLARDEKLAAVYSDFRPAR